MSEEDHEELSPLHRVMNRIQARLDTNVIHADRHPDHNIRYDAAVRCQAYRLVMSELNEALTIVAKTQVDRIVAKRAKQLLIANEAAIKAMKVV